MNNLISIDPGLVHLGWAQWRSGTLYRCGLSSIPREVKSLSERASRHHAAIQVVRDGERVYCERMMARGKFSSVDPQDLIDLNLVAGRLGTEFLTSDQWKGSVPRDVEQDRTQNALTADELKLLKPYDRTKKSGSGHNVWSAVGIGLSLLGRAHKGKIR